MFSGWLGVKTTMIRKTHGKIDVGHDMETPMIPGFQG